MYLQDYLSSQHDDPRNFGGRTPGPSRSIGMDGSVTGFSDENISTTSSQLPPNYFSPYSTAEEGEETVLVDHPYKSPRRKQAVILCTALVLAVAVFAIVGSFASQKKNNNQVAGIESSVEVEICQPGIIKEVQSPQLEIYMTGVSRLPTDSEKERLETAVSDGYNQVSGGCADKFQRWMYNVTLAEQRLHEEVVLTEKTTRISHGFEDISTYIARFETQISCQGCSGEDAFADVFPTLFGQNSGTRKNRRNLFEQGFVPDSFKRRGTKVHGKPSQALRQLPEAEPSRLDAGEILVAIENLARNTIPGLEGFLEVTIVTSGNDGSSTATTIARPRDSSQQYLPSYFREEAISRAQGLDCYDDEDYYGDKKRKKSSKSSKSGEGYYRSSRSSKSSKSSKSESRRSESRSERPSEKRPSYDDSDDDCGKKNRRACDSDDLDGKKGDSDDYDNGKKGDSDDYDDGKKGDSDDYDDGKKGDSDDYDDGKKGDSDDYDDGKKGDSDDYDFDYDGKKCRSDDEDSGKKSDEYGSYDNESGKKSGGEYSDDYGASSAKKSGDDDYDYENSYDDYGDSKRNTNNPACSVCGADMEVTSFEAIFEWQGQEPTKCGDLQQAGYEGLIPADSCKLLPDLIKETCECQPQV